jgi:hypothetical protein
MQKNQNVGKIFLLVFILMIGLSQVFYGIYAVNHYNMSFDVSRFPTPEGVPSVGQDFGGPWFGAVNMAKKERVYFNPNVRLANKTANLYNYPPLVALLYQPYTHLSFETGFRVHLVVLLLFYFITIWVLGKIFSFSLEHYTYALAIGLLSMPFHFEFERGNVHTPLLCWLFLSYYFILKHRDAVAGGLFLALAALFKIYPVLFIVYFLIKREFKVVFYASLFIAMIVTVNGGWHSWFLYVKNLGVYQLDVLSGDSANHSTFSFFWRFFKDQYELNDIKFMAKIFNYFLLGSTLIYFGFFGGKTEKVLTSIEISCLLILTNFVPNRAYGYYLVFMPFLIFALIRSMEQEVVLHKLKKSHTLSIFILALLVNFILITPWAGLHYTNQFNHLLHFGGWSAVSFLRQTWYKLFYLFLFLLILHQWLFPFASKDPLIKILCFEEVNGESKNFLQKVPRFFKRFWQIVSKELKESFILQPEKNQTDKISLRDKILFFIDGSTYSSNKMKVFSRCLCIFILLYIFYYSGPVNMN